MTDPIVVPLRTIESRTLPQSTDRELAPVELKHVTCATTTAELLKSSMTRALARDAVQSCLRIELLIERIRAIGLSVFETRSCVSDRAAFVKRPDLAGKLAIEERARVGRQAFVLTDVAIVIADGWSARAVDRKALAFLAALLPRLAIDGCSIAPVAIVSQARCAIGQEIGRLLKARLVLVLIGEAPTAIAIDRLGVYLDFASASNGTSVVHCCISADRSEGLSPSLAAARIHRLISEYFMLDSRSLLEN